MARYAAMPEMNDRDLAEEITALCPGIRLLFMSGYTKSRRFDTDDLIL
jgi:hypothetical protein